MSFISSARVFRGGFGAVKHASYRQITVSQRTFNENHDFYRLSLPILLLLFVNSHNKLSHRHRINKYLDTLLASQTGRKALPPTTTKSGNCKMADCLSYY